MELKRTIWDTVQAEVMSGLENQVSVEGL